MRTDVVSESSSVSEECGFETQLQPRAVAQQQTANYHDAAEAGEGDCTNSRTGSKAYPMEKTRPKCKAAHASICLASAE